MINNLAEFLDNRGYECDTGSMYSYGRALYKYSFGPWTAYLVEDAPAQDIEYSMTMKRTKGGHVFLVPGGVVPEDIAGFFLINHDFGMNTFDEYAELIAEFKAEHTVSWDYTLTSDTLVITGTHHIPAAIREIYYDSAEGKNKTLALANKCVGIKVGSIIEGANFDAEPFTMMFPFEPKDYDSAMSDLALEVDIGWEEANDWEDERV